jgi:predicted dehydrogenase
MSNLDAPLRVILVGAGKMGTQHARAIAALRPDEAHVVGVVDPSEAARESLLTLAPGAVGEASLRALLARAEADVVHVCTPMETHAAVAHEALDHGKHVYVEKPATPTLDELTPLLENAERKGLELCAGHQVLFERPYLRLLECLPGWERRFTWRATSASGRYERARGDAARSPGPSS